MKRGILFLACGVLLAEFPLAVIAFSNLGAILWDQVPFALGFSLIVCAVILKGGTVGVLAAILVLALSIVAGYIGDPYWFRSPGFWFSDVPKVVAVALLLSSLLIDDPRHAVS